MKVQSWRILLITVLLGGGALIYELIEAMKSGTWDVIWIVLLAVVIGQGLVASLSKKGYEQEKQRRKESEAIDRRLFGKGAKLAPWGSFLFLLLALGSKLLFPDHLWLGLLFLSLFFLYEFLMIALHIK